MCKGWIYYRQALIPNMEPHNEVEFKNNREFWKCDDGRPLLARWTTKFDCKSETNWWYVIKDDSFQIDKLKSDYRYKIKKGEKFFETRIIDPIKYVEELFEVYTKAYMSYPVKYRPKVNKKDFADDMLKLKNTGKTLFFGAFDRESGRLEGVLVNKNSGICHYLDSLRVNPGREKHQINAALVKALLDYYDTELSSGSGYICDGEKNILHETRFQDYLEKYFGFRKAYCFLNVKYRGGIGAFVKMLYPFRRLLYIFDSCRIIHKINGVMKMEEIVRVDNHKK